MHRGVMAFSPKRVMLVRHGETDYNKQKLVQGRGINSSLNDLGISQAVSLGKSLKALDIKVDYIACSTLKRAIQTTEILKKELGSDIEIETFPDLEEMGYGEWEGKPFDESHPETVYPALIQLHSEWANGNVHVPIPGGENPIQVEERAVAIIKHILQKNIKNPLIVAHGRMLRIVLCSLLKYGLHAQASVLQDNTALNILHFDGKDFSAIELNSTKHLLENVEKKITE